MRMVVDPATRLFNFDTLTTLFLGGLRGPWEKIFVALALVWILLALLRRARNRRFEFDSFLLVSAATCFALAVLLPDKVDRTILLAWRWGPIALALAVLAAPLPLENPTTRGLLATLAAAVLLIPTNLAWRAFQSEEMAGFEEALAGIPANVRVAGLDFVRKSPRFSVDPYFQMFAYASVERGAMINFSFSQMASSMVQVEDPLAELPWTRGLEWQPNWLTANDLQYFDFLLLHATPQQKQRFTTNVGTVRPEAGAGNWTLLRVDRSEVVRRLSQTE